MHLTQWLRMSGALMILAALLPPRIGVLRPHARRIGIVACGLYIAFAAGVVILRIIIGPELFME